MKFYIKNHLEIIFVFFYLFFHLYFFNLDQINDEYIFYTGADLIKTLISFPNFVQVAY